MFNPSGKTRPDAVFLQIPNRMAKQALSALGGVNAKVST